MDQVKKDRFRAVAILFVAILAVTKKTLTVIE